MVQFNNGQEYPWLYKKHEIWNPSFNPKNLNYPSFLNNNETIIGFVFPNSQRQNSRIQRFFVIFNWTLGTWLKLNIFDSKLSIFSWKSTVFPLNETFSAQNRDIRYEIGHFRLKIKIFASKWTIFGLKLKMRFVFGWSAIVNLWSKFLFFDFKIGFFCSQSNILE